MDPADKVINAPSECPAMEQNPESVKETERILDLIKRKYGFIPVVNQILSERPDMFIPVTEASKSILEHGVMDRKSRMLCAVSASAALCGEYCLDVQIAHAADAGADRDEILEAIMIGCQMNFTRSQSYALRRFADAYGVEKKEIVEQKFPDSKK